MSRHHRSSRIALAVGLALTLAAGVLVSGGLVAAGSQVAIDDSVATLIALTMAVAVAGAGGGWLVHRRGDPILGARLQMLGVLSTAGVTRHLDLGRFGLVVAGACWLAAPVAGLAVAAAIEAPRPATVATGPRRARWLLAGAAVAALAAALVGGSVGPGSWTDTTVGATIPPLARGLAVSQAAMLAVAIVVTLGRRRAIPTPGRSLEWISRSWAVVTVAAVAGHLLPGRWLFAPDGYRPWAETLALKMPLVATLALLVAVAYDRTLRPWLLPAPDRVMLDLDRLPSLDAGLPRWTADPTVQLSFPAPGGGWTDSRGRAVGDGVASGAGRFAVVLSRGGAPVARIEHDGELAAQPGLVDYDIGLVSAVLSAERDADLAASRLTGARRASAGLLRADDDARRELQGRLVAGPVATLEELAAGLTASPVEPDLAVVADRIRQVAADVRQLSHGLYPPELATGGLAAALPLAPGAPARRLPPAVEVTAYLIATGAPEAVLDDQGSWLDISVPGCAGLPVERIEALGGRVRPLAEPDSGEVVHVELPTAWE